MDIDGQRDYGIETEIVQRWPQRLSHRHKDSKRGVDREPEIDT